MTLAAYDLNLGVVEAENTTQWTPDVFYDFSRVFVNKMVFPRPFFDAFRRHPERFEFESFMRIHEWSWETISIGVTRVEQYTPLTCTITNCDECEKRQYLFLKIKQKLIQQRDAIRQSIDALTPAIRDGDGAIKFRVFEFLI